MSKKKQIKKYDRPSEVRKKAITKARKELIDYVVKHEGVSKDRATEIVNDEKEYAEVMNDKDKKLRLRIMNEMLPKAVEAYEKKVKRGSMKQAKETVVAMGILKDKALGADKYSQAINIGGKNVQVNLGFDFKPYKKKE